MKGRPRFVENRMVFVVLPKAPFINWINQVDPDVSGDITLDMIQDEPNVFLVPTHAADSDLAGERWLLRNWRLLFERILTEWAIDKPLWPSFEALEAFTNWFDVKVHSVILDCSSEPIEYEKEIDTALI